jgi:hypothetical protein
MAKNRPAPRVYEHKPQPTISKAVAAAKAHVNNVNKTAK